MIHECEQKEAILKIFNVLDAISVKIGVVETSQALTNQLLRGNGVKGLCERVEDAENSIKTTGETIGSLNHMIINQRWKWSVLGAAITFVISNIGNLCDVIKILLKGIL